MEESCRGLLAPLRVGGFRGVRYLVTIGDAWGVADATCVDPAGREVVVPPAARRSADAEASGPLQTATVAAMAHRIPAAMALPRNFLIAALSSRII